MEILCFQHKTPILVERMVITMKKFDSSLYFITDSTSFAEEEFLYRVERALMGGATLLQLREKNKRACLKSKNKPAPKKKATKKQALKEKSLKSDKKGHDKKRIWKILEN